MFKGSVTAVPFAPPPLCGIPDPETVRSLFDLTHWLDSTPGYCLSKYNAALRAMLSSLRPTAVFFPGRTFLPTTTSEFTKKLFERVGLTVPGSISPISSDDEQKLIYPLLAELCTRFKLSMDTLPNLSRDMVITPRVAHQEDDIPALFIGGSNADKLANAAASLGVVADTITEGGWILSTSSVSIILPQVEAYCATLPPDAPVVIYCLDNSSFCCADQDGTLSAIAKDKSDNKYHVVGELVVVHEITMAAAVTNLKRLLAICGDRKVFIITPCLRYANASCCSATGHCVHRLIPDFAIRLLEDLRRLHSFFKQRLSSFANCTVIPAGDLIAGKKDASTSDIIAAYSGWGTVHGSGTSYTRMALYMMDNLFRVPIAKPAPPSNKGKRPRSESNSSSVSSSYSGTGSSSRRDRQDDRSGGDRRERGGDRRVPSFVPGFFRGGSRGSSRGGPRGGQHDGSKRGHFDSRSRGYSGYSGY
jgi:hypothetical protein